MLDVVVVEDHRVFGQPAGNPAVQSFVLPQKVSQGQQVSAGGHDVIGLPVHQHDVQLSVGHGGQHLQLGGVGILVVLLGGVPAQVQSAVEGYLFFAGICADGSGEPLVQRPVEVVPDGDVRAGDVQQRVLACEPVVQETAQGHCGDERQRQRKLIVFKDVAELPGQAHVRQRFAVFRPLRFRQLHSCAPVSASSDSSCSWALGS